MGQLFSRKVAVDADDADTGFGEVEVRRRNSLAFYIAQYAETRLSGGDMKLLHEEIKKDKYSKSNGRIPNFRPSKLNKIADSIAQGNMRELRNQVFVFFRHINREYRDLHGGNAILHIICQEGLYPALAHLCDPMNRSGLDSSTEINFAQLNDRGRSALFLCCTPPVATLNAFLSGVDDNGNAIVSKPPELELNKDWFKPGGAKSREGCIKLLLSHGAPANTRDFHDFTALHYTCMLGWTNATKALMEAGADPNIQNKAGRTALMNAAVFGSVGCAQVLMEFKGRFELNLDLTDQEGHTALVLAIQAEEKSREIASLLLEAKADTDKQTLQRITALKLACRQQDVPLINKILDCGAQRRNSAFVLLEGGAANAIQSRLDEDERKAREEEETEPENDRPRMALGPELAFALENGLWSSSNASNQSNTPWVVYRDRKTKRPFYYHTLTRKVTWDKPRDLRGEEKQIVKDAIFGLHFYH